MSFLIQPPVSSGSRQPGDELDNLLRAYFQAEMPNPWPALEIGGAAGPADEPSRLSLVSAAEEDSPLAEPLARSPFLGRALVRSRLALAASVALLVSGPLFLGSQLQNAPTTAEVSIPHEGGSAHKDPDGLLTPRKVKEEASLIQQPDGTHFELKLFEVSPRK